MNEQPDKVQMKWTDSRTHESVEGFVMSSTISDRATLSDGTTALFLTDGEAHGTTIRVADTYFCEADGAEQQDTQDMWIENGVAPSAPSISPAPSVSEAPTVAPSMTLAPSMTPAPSISDDYDDSVPVISGGMVMEVAAETVELDDETEDKKAKAKATTAAQKAAAARKELHVQPDNEVLQSMQTDIGKALVQGKRHDDFKAWNFKAMSLPTVAVYTDPTTGKVSYLNYSKNGAPVNYVLVNPAEANPNAEADDIESIGHVINPRHSQAHGTLDHADWMIPFAEAVQDIQGVKYDRYSIKKGARGAMTIDLTDMATSTRQEAASNLTGYLNLDANSISSILHEENGGHRCGVTMLNPLDGKGAFSAHLTVMRTYCGNLAMRGTNQLMFKVRHTAGSIAAFDIDATALKLRSAFQEAQQHLLAAHLLKWIPIEGNMFDKMLTTFDAHGLITKPSIAIDVHDYDKLVIANNNGTQLPKEQIQSMLRVGRGHAYKAVMHGYVNPDVDYVNLQENDAVDSANHVMNAVTGMLSNSPIIVDDFKDKNGKMQQRVLKGGKGASMEGFMKKSAKSTRYFENMAEANVKVYCEAVGQDVLTTDDLPKMKQWFTDNPDKIVVAHGKNMDKTRTLESVPEYHETWMQTNPKTGKSHFKILTDDQKL
tara:strand:- start:682 stop:2649 length:1968 start_codon:yes stop_codon:yes gene_type:complete